MSTVKQSMKVAIYIMREQCLGSTLLSELSLEVALHIELFC